jgi:hypothetical protein
MRSQRVINEVKLQAYEDDDRVIGVRVINPCTPATTPLCESLAGCDGEPAEAYFGAEESIGLQLQDATDADTFAGFDPLPIAPPYHHQCRSELAPIVAD